MAVVILPTRAAGVRPAFYGVNWASPQAVGLRNWYVCDQRFRGFVDVIRASSAVKSLILGQRFAGDGLGNYVWTGANDQAVECGPSVSPQSAATVVVWCRPTTTLLRLIASAYDTGDGTAWLQVYQNASTYTGRLFQVKDATYIGRIGGTVVAGQADCLVVRWTGGTTNAAIQLFQNGRQVDTTDDGAGSFTAANTGSATFRIGSQDSVPPYYYSGAIWDVRVYTRALNDQEIFQTYAEPTRWDLYWQPSRRFWLDLGPVAASATADSSDAITVSDIAAQTLGIRVSAAEYSGSDTVASSNW